MRFTRLRVLGFKSFVEPTEFLIEPGLTGVVGPNGCGKSNLVEALRWVMGESSYRNMRASGMDDVIFSGSGNRPARNTAEVTLVVDNADRTAPAATSSAEQPNIPRTDSLARTSFPESSITAIPMIPLSANRRKTSSPARCFSRAASSFR